MKTKIKNKKVINVAQQNGRSSQFSIFNIMLHSENRINYIILFIIIYLLMYDNIVIHLIIYLFTIYLLFIIYLLIPLHKKSYGAWQSINNKSLSNISTKIQNHSKTNKNTKIYY